MEYSVHLLTLIKILLPSVAGFNCKEFSKMGKKQNLITSFFYNILLQDLEIDAFELKEILSTATKKGNANL